MSKAINSTARTKGPREEEVRKKEEMEKWATPKRNNEYEQSYNKSTRRKVKGNTCRTNQNKY